MKVKFLPQDIELEIAPDQSVMELAHQNGIFIKTICNGMPSCAECRVRVTDGEYNVLPPSTKELSLIGTGYFIDQRRLSCQLRCFGDITVDLTEQIEKQKDMEGPRRPQGTLKKDESEQSFAVTGNLIEQEVELLKATEVEEPQRPRREQRADRGPRPHRGPRAADGASARGQSEGQGSGGGRRRRRRRR